METSKATVPPLLRYPRVRVALRNADGLGCYLAATVLLVL
jgi:hypothetical protein